MNEAKGIRKKATLQCSLKTDKKMGGVLTRNRNNGDDSGDSSSQSAYRYPPKSGSSGRVSRSNFPNE